MLEGLNKRRAYLTLALFIIIAFIFWYFSDSFSKWISEANPFLALIVTIIINPAYLLLIFWLYKQYGIRGIFSGILISLSIDIISLTHSISKIAVLPTEAQAIPLYGYSDTTFFKIMSSYVHGAIASFILYVIIPGLLVYLALRIVRRTSSFNRIVKEAI